MENNFFQYTILVYKSFIWLIKKFKYKNYLSCWTKCMHYSSLQIFRVYELFEFADNILNDLRLDYFLIFLPVVVFYDLCKKL